MIFQTTMILRRIVGRPRETGLAVFALASAIAANLAINAVFHSVLLRPLPIQQPDRVAVIRLDLPGPGGHWRRASLREAQTLWQTTNSWAGIAFRASRSIRLEQIGGLSEDVSSALVDGAFFNLLGVKTSLGRTFVEDDLAEHRKVVVISEAAHRRIFGGKDLQGLELRTTEGVFSVVGVLPKDFRLIYAYPCDVWLAAESSEFAPLNVEIVGRLKDGITLAEAQKELDTLGPRVVGPPADDKPRPALRAIGLYDLSFASAASLLRQLSLASGLVLFLASFNVGALLLGKEITRRHQTEIQAALGASPKRLLLQSLTSNALMGLFAGFLGLIFAYGTMDLWTLLIPGEIPRADSVTMNLSQVIMATTLSLAAGLLAGLFPSLSAFFSGARLRLSISRGGTASRRENRVFQILVGVEVALAFALCLSAGLLLKSMVEILTNDLGFQPQRAVFFDLKTPRSHFASESQRTQALSAVLESLKRSPEIEAASVSLSLPFADIAQTTRYAVQGRVEENSPQAIYNPVSESFFQMLQIPVLAGRGFSLEDNAVAPQVAIVSSSLARRLWLSETAAVGRSIVVRRVRGEKTLRIVGVVGDLRQHDLVSGVQDAVYVPLVQDPQLYATVVVRTLKGRPLSLETIKSRIGKAAPGIRWDGSSSLQSRIAQTYARQQFATAAVTLFATLGLILSLVGIFSTVQLFVRRRLREFGVRAALGANSRQLVQSSLGMIILPIAGGILSGALLSAVFTQWLGSLFGALPASDPISWIAVAVVMVAGATVTAYLPAREAIRLDVMKVITCD